MEGNVKIAVAKIEPFQESLFAHNYMKFNPENTSLQIFSTSDINQLEEEIELKGNLRCIDTTLANELVDNY